MNTEVLVVGAGPTGLTVALLLADAGVQVRIIDAAPERSPYSRALVVQARTLELLDRHGLAAPLVEAGHVAPATTLHVDGAEVLRVELGRRMPTDTPFPMALFISQVEVEQVLEAALRARGVEVERPVRLAAFTEGADAVHCSLEGAPDVRAQWLVGADGAHSVVRKGLGLPFDGAPYKSHFLLGDVVLQADVPTDEIHVFLARTGVTILFPLPGPTTRVITTDPDGGEGALSRDELQDKALSKAGRSWQMTDPVWLSRFHLHHRGVPRYRRGRCFVAGDAAHIHSPAGGQGMNTGIQDGFNLAWKLAMVLRRGADPTLLDTYDQERQPVGRRLLSFTDRGFSLATQDNEWFTAVRNRVLPWLAPAVATPARQAAVARFVSQIGIRYRHTDLAGQHGAFEVGPAPGERLEDPVCRGPGWWLLGAGDAPLWQARVEGWAGLFPWLSLAWGPPRHGLQGPGLLLVRPDGHLAFRSAGEALDPISAFVASHLDTWGP